MHLLFLGVVKAARELISTWIVDTKRQIGYKVFSKGMFEPIEDMGLDWMKILTVQSGWVSDNYLAFSRLCKWYYSPFHYIKEDIYEEPTVPINNWYVKNCKEWLIAHDFDSMGKIEDLKNRIKTLKRDKENPPKLKKGKGCSVEQLSEL